MAEEEIFSDAMEDLDGSSDDIDDAADDANESGLLLSFLYHNNYLLFL